MAQSSHDILIILVNYFNETEVKQFIENELNKQEGVFFDVVIVNNGSKNTVAVQDFDFVKGKCHVINPGKNLGYLNGAKSGFDFYLEINKKVPLYTILSNTDIVFTDNLFLKNLVENNYEKSVGVIGPDILSSLTNHHQNPMYTTRPSKRKMNLWLMVFGHYMYYVLYQVASYIKRFVLNFFHFPAKQLDPYYVYSVHGSCMIFARTYFDKGCELGYPGFLYAEELYIAEQCAQHKLKICYDPRLHIIHAEHSTSGKIKTRKHIKWLYESLSLIKKKYYIH